MLRTALLILLSGLAACRAEAGSQAMPARDAAADRARVTREAEQAWIEARMAAQRQAQALAQEISRRVEAGTARPEAEAAEAGRRGEFGLMVTVGRFGREAAPGAICFTPWGRPARSLARYHYGDAIGPEESRFFAYADAYNRALTARPDYPDADLCRPATGPEDGRLRFEEDGGTRAARPPGRSPRTLHEAARWGDGADIGRLSGSGPIDAMDGAEMTPLAWAVARDNRPAADALLAAGASAWAGPPEQRIDPVSLAAVLGRARWFDLLAERPGRPFERWSAVHLAAAAAGGDRSILTHMLRQPHDPPRIDMLRSPLPAAPLMELLLRDAPGQAPMLLRRAVTTYESRADLVRLALDHGADPNAPPPQQGQETALGEAASGIGPQSLEIVDLLLRAGADPNALTWRSRPLWRAVQTIRLENGRSPEIANRARAVFARLRAGGADINRPDFQGRPPVWTLLFPRAYAHRELDAYYVTPTLLEMLVRAGLNLNAKWENERVLAEVERQAGERSELATALRRLGARR